MFEALTNTFAPLSAEWMKQERIREIVACLRILEREGLGHFFQGSTVQRPHFYTYLGFVSIGEDMHLLACELLREDRNDPFLLQAAMPLWGEFKRMRSILQPMNIRVRAFVYPGWTKPHIVID